MEASQVKTFAETQLAKILPTRGFTGRFFLAGGCFKSLIHGNPPRDLDLWPASDDDGRQLLQLLKQEHKGNSTFSEGEFNHVVKISPRERDELSELVVEITKHCPSSLVGCIDRFDLVLCSVGVEYKSGRIVSTFIHPDVDRSIMDKEIRLISNLRPSLYTLRSLDRMKRYGTELGFSVSMDSIRKVWDIYAVSDNREGMLHAAGLTEPDVPIRVRQPKQFQDGRPQERCREYTKNELTTLRNSLRATSKCSSPPIAIYVVGLPGSGKTSVLDRVLQSWRGMPAKEDFAVLDMDVLRSFHEEYSRKLRQEKIFKDLIPWFNEGSNAETVLYKDPEAIVTELVNEGRNIILPIHTTKSVSFMEYATRSFGYAANLLVIEVSLKVAQDRALARARATGRYVSAEYMADQDAQMKDILPIAKAFVEGDGDGGGEVMTFNNEKSWFPVT